MIHTDRASSHANQRSFDAAAAKDDLIGAAFQFARIVGGTNGQIGGRQRADRNSRPAQKITTRQIAGHDRSPYFFKDFWVIVTSISSESTKFRWSAILPIAGTRYY